MTVIIDGTAGITFPDTSVQAVNATNASNISSGTLGKARLPTGSVLQVVSASLSSNVSTSSASYVTTGLTASITPSSSSSKVLVIVNTGAYDSDTANNSILVALYKNGNEIISPASVGFVAYTFSSGNRRGNNSLNYLDSPATTSATTYAIYNKRDGTGLVFFNKSGVANITLMEIAA